MECPPVRWACLLCWVLSSPRLLAVVCAQGPRVPGCRRQALSSPHAVVGDSGAASAVGREVAGTRVGLDAPSLPWWSLCCHTPQVGQVTGKLWRPRG